jgi:phospho-N-acetylmuramoyl-pentapeptide-transferase
MLLQLAMTLLIGIALAWLYSRGAYEPDLVLPFFKNNRPSLVIGSLLASPWTYPLAFVFFFAFLFFVLVGSSNAVNLTDGLDGLAIGLTIICGGALTVLAYVAGHREMAVYLDIARVPQAAELTVFCGALVGASLAFLWYNCHPAEIFMGDVGSLALGGAMGAIAILVKQEILLLFVGGVFVAEVLSVILQVGSFKLRGRRVFKMAPLHHHFEALGWSESKIIIRFWIAGLVWALLALSTLKLR